MSAKGVCLMFKNDKRNGILLFAAATILSLLFLIFSRYYYSLDGVQGANHALKFILSLLYLVGLCFAAFVAGQHKSKHVLLSLVGLFLLQTNILLFPLYSAAILPFIGAILSLFESFNQVPLVVVFLLPLALYVVGYFVGANRTPKADSSPRVQ